MIFFRWLLRLLFRVVVTGDALPLTSGKTLVIANHPSPLDGLLLAVFLPGKPVVVFPAGEKRCPVVRAFLAVTGHVALEIHDPATAGKISGLLEAGRPVVLFPEGRVNRTGSPMKMYPAPVLAAAGSGANIVPVHIEASGKPPHNPLSARFPKAWRPKIALHVLPPATASFFPEAGKQLPGEAANLLRRTMQQAAFSCRRRQSLFQAFLEALTIYGRRTRIIEDIRGREESYGALLKTSLALGRWLCGYSAEKEAVGVLLPNLIPTVGIVLGLTAMRRMPAMLNFTAGISGIAAACASARVKTVVTSRQFLEHVKLDSALPALAGIRIVYLEDFRPSFKLTDRLWLAAALCFPRLAAKRADPGEAALILFTSGSEERPKGVALGHDAILANIAQIRATIDFSPNDKFLNILPMYHAYGFTVCTVLPLLNGAHLLLYPSPLHYHVIPEIVYQRDCSCIFGSSAFLRHYAKHAHPYDFYRVRYVISGGEKLSTEVSRVWQEKFGLRILEGYGAAECAPVLAVNTPLAYKAGSVGQFLPGIEYRLEAVPGIEKGGVLHVRGPNVMLGYYFSDQPGVLHPPHSRFGAGWHCTGDVVEVDEEGFVTITGRVKRFAKIAGEMVSLEVVERIASHASPAHHHAATLAHHPERGEVIVLFTTDAALNRPALAQAAKQAGSPDLAVPRKIVHLAELPLLSIGKTDYVALAELARSADGTAAGGGGAPEAHLSARQSEMLS